MKIALVQFSPCRGDLDATLKRLAPLLASCTDADLVVLPELANSGYAFASKEEAAAGAEGLDESLFLSFLEAFAKEYGLHIVTGFNEREGERLYNSAVLLDGGGVRGLYRKLHLFDREKLFFTPGDRGAPVFPLGPWVLGLAICYDWRFPELWRMLALKGADLVAHPSNLVLPGQCQQAVPAQALINRIFILTANRVGKEAAYSFTGRSLVATPDGQVLAEGDPTREQVVRAQIDPGQARNKQITPRNHVLEDRRPALYTSLTDPQKPGPAPS